jgi:hypothetical protein
LFPVHSSTWYNMNKNNYYSLYYIHAIKPGCTVFKSQLPLLWSNYLVFWCAGEKYVTINPKCRFYAVLEIQKTKTCLHWQDTNRTHYSFYSRKCPVVRHQA